LGIVTKLLERGSLAALARLILHQLLREIANRDTLTTHDEHALENVLQLPDIPRPGIALQLPHDFLIQLLGLEIVLFADPAGENPDQQGNVLRPFTQARYLDRHDVEPIVKVLTEGAAGHSLLQILVGP